MSRNYYLKKEEMLINLKNPVEEFSLLSLVFCFFFKKKNKEV
jgi:hypothetical protein